jgi:hypothetical protein
MSSFKGFAVLQRPTDLVAKLEYDLERMRAAPEDVYAAFDFFVTAEHIVDWLLPDSPGSSQLAARKVKRDSSELLKVTSHIANGAKHFQALAKHHDTVADLEQESGRFDPRSFSPRSFSPASFKMHGLNVRLEDGRVVHVLTLAEDVLRYWQREIGSP